MVAFSVLYSDGSPAKQVLITLSVPGEKLEAETDERGYVSFDIQPQRGSIAINGNPLFYGYLDVDAFQIPLS